MYKHQYLKTAFHIKPLNRNCLCGQQNHSHCHDVILVDLCHFRIKKFFLFPFQTSVVYSIMSTSHILQFYLLPVRHNYNLTILLSLLPWYTLVPLTLLYQLSSPFRRQDTASNMRTSFWLSFAERSLLIASLKELKANL